MTVFNSKIFNKRIFSIICLPLWLGFSCCQSQYDKQVKKEMASGKRIDTLKFGLVLGGGKKEFFATCWELNKKKLIQQGPKNQYVAYKLKGSANTSITHLFYGIFNEDQKMTGLDMEFAYDGWSPWTPELQSSKLIHVAMDTLMKWYPGNAFFKLNHDKVKTPTYIKIDGNRQIIIHAQGDKDVKATLEDLRYKFPSLN